jgi:hypothetical protein
MKSPWENFIPSQATVSTDNPSIVGFEALIATVMKGAIFWDTTPCSPLKFKRRFRRTYRLHLQSRTSRARYQRKTATSLHRRPLKLVATDAERKLHYLYLSRAYICRGADKSSASLISYFPVCSTSKIIFLGWVEEVRTTKS